MKAKTVAPWYFFGSISLLATKKKKKEKISEKVLQLAKTKANKKILDQNILAFSENKVLAYDIWVSASLDSSTFLCFMVFN